MAGLETSVTVAADTEALETARSQIVGTIPQAEVQSLPMNGRNFLDLALLVPGVSPTNTNSTQLFAETSAVPGQGISVASQRNLSNSFIVDGLSANDDAAGLSGITFGVDAIEQFQVVTGGGQAELGRALGGYINVVTTQRHQRPARHGLRLLPRRRLQRPQRPDRHASCRWTSSSSAPASADRSRGTAPSISPTSSGSGSIRPASSRSRRRTSPPSTRGWRRSAIRVRRSRPASTPTRCTATNALGKIDHQLSGADQFTVRYALLRRQRRQRARRRHAQRAVGLDEPGQRRSVGGGQQRLDAVAEHRQRDARPGRPRRPQGVLDRPGRPAGHDRRRGDVRHLLQQPDPAPEHDVSRSSTTCRTGPARTPCAAGVDFLYNDDTITFLRTFRGSYTFSSLANFLTGTYSGFAQTFGDPVVNQKNPNVGLFAQDEWRAGSQLTLNLGLRYDLQFLETIDTDRNNVSPRAGFVWTPTASRDLVVRGGAGLFFDRVPLRAVANALLSAGNTTDVDAAATAAGLGHPADAGRRPGVPEHPARSAAVDGPRLDHHDGQASCRTPTRSRPTSRSSARSAAAGR